jgi:hypothetical protein
MLITETHSDGNFERTLPKGQLFIHHGPNVQPPQVAKGGIAVILSEELAMDWKKRKCKTINGGEIAGITRFMSIHIKLEIVNSTNISLKKKKNLNHHVLTLIPCYFPHSGYKEAQLDSLTELFSQFYSSSVQAKNASVIIGADIIAFIGNRNSDNEHLDPRSAIDTDEEIDSTLNLLGSHGNPYRNSCGERVLNMMRELDLRAPSPLFDSHGKFNARQCPKKKNKNLVL